MHYIILVLLIILKHVGSNREMRGLLPKLQQGLSELFINLFGINLCF